MKSLLLPILLLSFLFAEGNKVNLKIDGMKCAYSCAGKVSEVVQNIKGVEECKVDFASGTAEVVYDDKKINSKKIVNFLNNETYYRASIQDKKDLKDNSI
ncbi:MAG: heavy-metal-associated domain-containing protein [Candidatus Neomarinimicrobiota bacterium]